MANNLLHRNFKLSIDWIVFLNAQHSFYMVWQPNISNWIDCSCFSNFSSKIQTFFLIDELNFLKSFAWGKNDARLKQLISRHWLSRLNFDENFFSIGFSNRWRKIWLKPVKSSINRSQIWIQIFKFISFVDSLKAMLQWKYLLQTFYTVIVAIKVSFSIESKRTSEKHSFRWGSVGEWKMWSVSMTSKNQKTDDLYAN